VEDLPHRALPLSARGAAAACTGCGRCDVCISPSLSVERVDAPSSNNTDINAGGVTRLLDCPTGVVHAWWCGMVWMQATVSCTSLCGVCGCAKAQGDADLLSLLQSLDWSAVSL